MTGAVTSAGGLSVDLWSPAGIANGNGELVKIAPNALVSSPSGQLWSMAIYLLDNPDGQEEFLTAVNWSLNTVAMSSPGFDQAANAMSFDSTKGAPDQSLYEAVIQEVSYQNNKVYPTAGSRRVRVDISDGVSTASATTMVNVGTDVPLNSPGDQPKPPKPPPQGGPPTINIPTPPLSVSLEQADVNTFVQFIVALQNKGYNVAAHFFTTFLGRKGAEKDDAVDVVTDSGEIQEIKNHIRGMVAELIIEDAKLRGFIRRAPGQWFRTGVQPASWDLSSPLPDGTKRFPVKVRFYPSDGVGKILNPPQDSPVTWWSTDDNLFYAFGGCLITLEGNVSLVAPTNKVADLTFGSDDLVVKIDDGFAFYGGSILDSDTALSLLLVQVPGSLLTSRSSVLSAGIYLEKRLKYAAFKTHAAFELPMFFTWRDFYEFRNP
jgi:hypothetical protein